MIDLYKQSEHQRSSLRHYSPVHTAAAITILILSLTVFSAPNADSSIQEGEHSLVIPDGTSVPGDGIDSDIRIAQDLRLDTTALPEDSIFWSDAPDEEIIDQLMATMTDEQIVGQVFMLGWLSEDASGPVVEWIRQRNIGGVKIFGWNGNNLARLSTALSDMQELALENTPAIPLFSATDQEGGWVRHIKDVTSVTPGNMAIGASSLPMDSYLSGYYIGRELRAIGVNMNFAPTVDVYVNNEAHVIGPRAFSSNPHDTAVLGLAFFHGMQQAGIVATAKHFPGHGNALGDSHGYLPIIQDDFDTVWERDLLPYRVMIPEGLPAILSGHLAFPQITGDERPASLSPYFKQNILRDRLDYEGIVITDDLYMGGAIEYGNQVGWDMPRIILEALRAGNDMVMLSEEPAFNDAIWQTVFAEYESDPEFAAGIRESVRRILTVKLKYLKPEWRVPFTIDPQQVYEDIENSTSEPFFQEQAARGVTLIRDDLIPFTAANSERVLLAGQDLDFLRQGQETYPGADRFYFDYSPFYWADDQVISDLQDIAENYDRIIFNLANPNSLQVLQAMEDFADRIIVFSTLTPVYLEDVPWVGSAIAVYGWGVESFTAGFAALHGDIPFRGQLPVTLNPQSPIDSQTAPESQTDDAGEN